jgi:spoIIIJ-associated protein
MIIQKKSIEIEGSTVADAIKRALSQLKVSRNDINVKIVSEEQKGLFGMNGAKPAKIIVTIREKKG